MKFYLFGRLKRVCRASLNLRIVLLFLLINVDVILVKAISEPGVDEGQLLFAALIHRHGKRNPINTYPNDPHKDYAWPGGYGALTRDGATEMYRMGLNLESRYKSLKPTDGIYSKETAHHVSSDSDRTKISGACILAAFYKPYPEYNSMNLSWQPVPMTVYPAEEDYIIHQTRVNCPRYNQAWSKLLNDPDPDSSIYQFNQEHRALYEYVSQHSGKLCTNCYAPGGLYDDLMIEESNGLELPEWTKKVYPDELYKCRVRAFQLMTETEEMKRLRGAPIVNEVVNEMLSFHNGSSHRNLYTYSAHDTTIINALSAMKMADQTNPLLEYGASLVFELRRILNSTNQEIVDFVQMVHYANTTVKTPQKLNITDCPHPCTLAEFAVTFQDLFMSNYTQECELPTP